MNLTAMIVGLRAREAKEIATDRITIEIDALDIGMPDKLALARASETLAGELQELELDRKMYEHQIALLTEKLRQTNIVLAAYDAAYQTIKKEDAYGQPVR